MSNEGLSRRFPFVNSGTRAAEKSGLSANPSLHKGGSRTPTSGNHAPSLLAPNLAPSSPLNWWRARKPSLLLCAGIGEIREALLGSEIPGQPYWTCAILGDAAVAIRVAVDQMKVHKITAIEVDLALSAVLACALEGDRASPIVISSALRRRSKRDPICKPLSDLWLVAKF
jgi:hypothetical protein